MKRLLLILALFVLILLAGYSGARLYTGQMLETEVEQLAGELALIEDIDLQGLRYEPGLYHGNLVYDVRVRLPAGHPLLDLARLSAPDRVPQWLTLQGTARISQGPHFTTDGVVLAWADQSWNGLHLRAGLKPSGTILGSLQGDALEGTFEDQAGGTFQVDLSAWDGDFQWRPEAQQLTLAAQIRQLVIGDAGFQGELQNATSEFDFSFDSFDQWHSRSRLTADRLELSSDESGTRLHDAIMVTEFNRSGDRIDNRLEVTLGESLVEQVDWYSGELRLALSGLDADAWMALLEELASGSADRQFTPERQDRLLRISDDLLAAGPTVNIERLAFRLYENSDAHDLAGAMNLHLPSGTGSTLLDPIDLLENAEIRLSLLASLGAIRRISEWRAEADARALAQEQNIIRTEEQIQRAAATMYRTTLLSLRFMPLVTVDGGKAETHLEMRQGEVYRNDERVMPVTQVLRLFGF